MNAQRNLGVSDAGMSKSLERLSSGYRINRAADDAAGLSISQSFRADIASYKVAQRNVSEANSMLQVAEGGLDQVGNMLTRMKELATQAASANSGSNLDKINAEYGQLMQEVDRIVNSTEYAGTKLLDGTHATTARGPSTAGPITYDDPAQGTLWNGKIRWGIQGALQAAPEDVTACNLSTEEGYYRIHAGPAGSIRLESPSGSFSSYITPSGTSDLVFADMGITITNQAGMDNATLDLQSININYSGLSSLDVSEAAAGTYKIIWTSDALTISDGTHNQTITGVLGDGIPITLNFNMLGISLTLDADYDQPELHNIQFDVTAGTPGSDGAVFQVGNNGDTESRISASINSAKTTDIGIGSGAGATSLNATSLDTAAHAQEAMQVIDKAIDDVSTIRSNIGADQNRFFYASSNLATSLENITSAESVVRDVDMAAEMTSFTTNQVLTQAATAMLAQANMASQGVLSLFK